MLTILTLPLLAFFALSAFFSLSETAIFASNKYKVRHIATRGLKPAQTLIGWLDALAVETVVLTLAILLFCELGPKALAARCPERISLRVVVPIEIFMKLFYPVTKYGLKVAGFFFRSVRQSWKSEVAGGCGGGRP